MKGDIPTAALRLMSCAVAVRTHERQHDNFATRASANNVRAVIIEGRLYESLTEASRQLNIGREALRKRIYKGTARYA